MRPWATRFSGNGRPEPETEEETPRQERKLKRTPAGLDMRTWNWERIPSPALRSDVLQPVEPLELVRDEQDETGRPDALLWNHGSILLDPASQASLTVEAGKAEDLAANPIEWMATAPPQPPEEDREPDSGMDIADSRSHR